MLNLWKKIAPLLVLLGVSTLSLQAQQKYNQRQTQKLRRLGNTYLKKYETQRKRAHLRALQTNIPIHIVSKNQVMELMSFSPNGIPLYYTTYNDIAAQTISTDTMRNKLNINGNGITLGIWDGGNVRTTHREFTRGNGTSRVTQRDNTSTGFNFHATHVAGTMVAAGVNASARGMAPGALLEAHDWTNDLAEMTAAARNGLLISNHSYGINAGWAFIDVDGDGRRDPVWFGDESISQTEDYKFGFYNDAARDLDALAFNAPNYLVCWAAGNDRSDAFNGEHFFIRNGRLVRSNAQRMPDGNYDCISGRGTAKNILTVGAVNDIAGGYERANQVVQSAFSSWGPTDDGRIKPDIVANGVNLNSTWHTSNSAYNSISGTSMATPSVSGSLGLLQQYFSQQNSNTFMRSATLKALVIHTADEAGVADGPDYQNGWGLMNTLKAAQVITHRADSSIIDERTLQNKKSYSVDVNALGGDTPLVVTIAWTDVAGTPVAPALNPATRMLVNDLDIRVTYTNPTTGAVTTHQPWILNPANPAAAATRGDNNRDNVEKIFIEKPVKGTYTIKVTHKGTLSNNNQAFSLIVTGIKVDNTNAACATPTGLSASDITSASAKLSWAPVSGAASYDLRYRVQGGATAWTTVSSITGSTRTVNSLSSGTAYEFQVRTNCGSNGNSSYAAITNFVTMGMPTGYCASQGGTADEFINRVQFGTINNVSGDNSGYGDFTTQTTTLSRGSTTPITITTQWNGTVYSEGYSVWIDLNRDGDFDDAGEQVYTQNPTSTASVSGNISIPANASLGLTRMRVAMRYNQLPATCGTYRYGEVEDYAVNITAAGTSAANAVTSIAPSNLIKANTFPNPANQQINVEVNTQGEASFVLRSKNGTVLQSKSAKATSGVARQVFDVKRYPAGFYYVTIQTKGLSQTKVVVVVK